MAEVIITGMFLNAEAKTTEFNGEKKTNVVLDVYQKGSEARSKAVQLKTDNINFLSELNSNYDVGSMITVKASVNAYQNQAYFRLLDIVS